MLPVFATVVTTFIFSGPLLFEPSESMTDKLMPRMRAGAAETATPEAMRATRDARREEENIVKKVMKRAGEVTPMKP